MATTRSSQSHAKRVQQIAEEAAGKIAADAPLEEEVIVVVEELPPAETPRTQRSRSPQGVTDPAAAMVAVAARGQQFVADAISRWIDPSSKPFDGAFFDPRRLTEDGFRFAHELLASQKEFALKVVELMTPTKAA
jgi:hypothetical protein